MRLSCETCVNMPMSYEKYAHKRSQAHVCICICTHFDIQHAYGIVGGFIDIVILCFFVHSMRWWSQFLYDQHLLGLLWLNWRTWGSPSSSNPLIHCFTMMSPKGWNRPTDLQFWPLPIPQFQVNISHRLHPFEASWRSRFFPTFLEFLYTCFYHPWSPLPYFNIGVFIQRLGVFHRSFSVMQMWWWRAPQSWTLPRRGSSSHLVPVTGKLQFWKSHGFPENRLQMVDVPHCTTFVLV